MVQIVQSWLEWLIFGLRGINLGLQHGTAFKTEISLSVHAFSAVRILKPLSIVNPKLSRTKISVFREASLQKCFSFPKSGFIYLAWGAFSEKPFRFFSEKFLAGGVNGTRKPGIKVAFGFKFLRRSLSGILSTKTGYTTFKCSLSFTSNSKLLSLFTWRASATWELKPGGHLKSGNLGLGVRAAFPTL